MKLSLGLLIAVALGDHIHHRWPPYTPLWVLFVGAAHHAGLAEALSVGWGRTIR